MSVNTENDNTLLGADSGMHESTSGIPAKTRAQKRLLPTVPDGWESSSSLTDTYVGMPSTIKAVVEDFIATKKRPLLRKGMDEAEADKFLSYKWGGVFYNTRHHQENFYVSPATVQALQKSGKLIPRNKEHAPADWQSLESIESQYAGTHNLIRGKILALAREHKAALIKEGYTPQKANAAVAERWASVYAVRPGVELGKRFAFHGSSNGQITDLHISPEALAALEKSGALVRKERLAPESWLTGVTLSESYIGGATQIDLTLKRFLRDRVNRLVDEGTPRRIAEETTYRNWGDCLKSRKNGSMVFHINPEALPLLENTGKLTLKTKTTPPAPEGWKSGKMLEKEYVGSAITFIAKIEKFAACKESELVASGINERDAAKTVQDKWAGYYSNLQGRQQVPYISPEGVKELKAAGTIIPLEKRVPFAPEGWRALSIVVGDYAGNDRFTALKIKTFLDGKKTQIPAEEVHKEWGGIYSNSQGGVGLFLSPRTLGELVEQNILQPRSHTLAPDSHLARELARREASPTREK